MRNVRACMVFRVQLQRPHLRIVAKHASQSRCPTKREGDLLSSSLEAETLRQPTRTINPGGEFSSRQPQLSVSGKVSECVAGISADCAAICCCCPFTLLHLLALLFLKIPANVLRKIAFNLKKKFLKRKEGAGGEEGDGGAASWSYKDRSKSEDVLQSSGNLLDQEFLREYFCCKQLGFGDQELFEHAME